MTLVSSTVAVAQCPKLSNQRSSAIRAWTAGRFAKCSEAWVSSHYSQEQTARPTRPLIYQDWPRKRLLEHSSVRRHDFASRRPWNGGRPFASVRHQRHDICLRCRANIAWAVRSAEAEDSRFRLFHHPRPETAHTDRH